MTTASESTDLRTSALDEIRVDRNVREPNQDDETLVNALADLGEPVTFNA